MILIFSNSTSTNMGGVEIFNEEFESLLNNHNIKYFRATSNTNNKVLNYISRLITSFYFIVLNYKKIDFILVQYGNFLDILSLPLLWATLKPIRIIAHIGDSWKHIDNQYMRLFTNVILNMFVQQVYIITNEQRVFLKHNNIKKIHTIINKQYALQKQNSYSDEKYLLFLGRICIEKGINDLILAYFQLNKRMELPILKIVGPVEEYYKRELNVMLNKYQIENKVFILEPVYEIDQKITLIDNAILLIYPSYADAFPLTVIESFARGICCIASSISETKNFIEFEDFLFSSGAVDELIMRLEYFLRNKILLEEKIKKMQKKSIKYAEGYIFYDIFQK